MIVSVGKRVRVGVAVCALSAMVHNQRQERAQRRHEDPQPRHRYSPPVNGGGSKTDMIWRTISSRDAKRDSS